MPCTRSRSIASQFLPIVKTKSQIVSRLIPVIPGGRRMLIPSKSILSTWTAWDSSTRMAPEGCLRSPAVTVAPQLWHFHAGYPCGLCRAWSVSSGSKGGLSRESLSLRLSLTIHLPEGSGESLIFLAPIQPAKAESGFFVIPTFNTLPG